MKRRIERIWSGSPIEQVRQTLVGFPRQYLLHFSSLLWLFLVALIMPHGLVPVDQLNELWHSPVFVYTFFGTWAFIALDSILALIIVPAPKSRKIIISTVLNILFPGARLIMIPGSPNHHFWLPIIGWQLYQRGIVATLEVFTIPIMMSITLLVLPVLGVQLLGLLSSEPITVWHWIFHTMTSIVWFAFVVEMMTMVNVSEQPIEYMKKHWVNLVIIVLPIIAFLRIVQLVRFISLAQYSRAFSLRGVVARAKHLILVFSLIERVLPSNPNKKLAKLLHKRDDLEIEMLALDAEIAQLHAASEEEKHRKKTEPTTPTETTGVQLPDDGVSH